MIKLKDILKEGSCGYGVDGKVGSQPAGPHLIKKKKKKKISVDERIPKLPRVNMGFGEAQYYSKLMIKKSEEVFKSTRGGDLGKAKKAVKDMEFIVTQIKRVLGI